MVGKEGVTDALVAAAEQALADHELIKVKVGESSPVDRHEAGEELARRTASSLAQVLGRTLLLYRRRAEAPEIALPGMPLPPKPKVEPEQKHKARPRAAPARARHRIR